MLLDFNVQPLVSSNVFLKTHWSRACAVYQKMHGDVIVHASYEMDNNHLLNLEQIIERAVSIRIIADPAYKVIATANGLGCNLA